MQNFRPCGEKWNFPPLSRPPPAGPQSYPHPDPPPLPPEPYARLRGRNGLFSPTRVEHGVLCHIICVFRPVGSGGDYCVMQDYYRVYQNDPKMTPKRHQNDSNMTQKNDSKMTPKGHRKWFQNNIKMKPKMIPKWRQSYPKNNPTWAQNHSKMTPKMAPSWHQNDPQWHQSDPKMLPKWPHNATQKDP